MNAKRKKLCVSCNAEFDVLFRIQYKHPREWVFACENCLLKLKKDNPLYKYGGTWKK